MSSKDKVAQVATPNTDDLKRVANEVWPSVKLALGTMAKATGTVSAGYLAIVQAKAKTTTLEEVRNHVPAEWRDSVSKESFLAEVKLASAFLGMFTKAGKSHTVQGEAIGEDPQAFLARFGSLKSAKAQLRDSLAIPVQVKTKATKAKGETKAGKGEVLDKGIDVTGKDRLANVRAFFGMVDIEEGEILLAECADILAKRKAKASATVTSTKAKAKVTK